MRTHGDDIAEVLALLGVRPVWHDGHRAGSPASRSCRSTELGRPRIDVTVRISGFFRDAFPHVISLLDDAVRARRRLDEPDERELRPGAHAARDERGRTAIARRASDRALRLASPALRRRASCS